MKLINEILIKWKTLSNLVSTSVKNFLSNLYENWMEIG